MSNITVAICTHNRADRLPGLINSLRQQKCQISFQILVINNNSTDPTEAVIRELSSRNSMPLKYVEENRLGITYARNRAIQEAMNSTYMAFIDDDELPGPNWLQATVHALEAEGAECAGGEIRVCLPVKRKPTWLTEELLGFLGQVNHGNVPFWISNSLTPIWSGNVAYRTELFSDGLRFDHRYNRQGTGIGGGEDVIMFQKLLEKKCRIRYRPDMLIEHLVGIEKLRRGYFLHLHFIAGCKFGHYQTGEYARTILGIPPFMVIQTLRQCGKALHL